MSKTKVASLLLSAATIATGCSVVNHQTHHDCTVLSKDIVYRVNDGSSSRTKRVSTTCGSFDVSDSISGGWQSWDNWAALKEGKAYDIETGSFRTPFTFPVVIRVSEATK